MGKASTSRVKLNYLSLVVKETDANMSVLTLQH